MKSIGIVACSAEGAALCYRTICLEAQESLGRDLHPEVSMHTHALGHYMETIGDGRSWDGVARLMLDSARKLAAAGADFLICPDNTIHQAFPQLEAESPLPWIHIARNVAAECARRGLQRPAILGTGFLMEGPVYPEALAAEGLEGVIPEEEERREIHAAIFDHLVQGRLREEDRRRLVAILDRMQRDEGCDSAVLGCTEIPLLIGVEDSPIPVLDSTRLLARAALRRAISD